MTNKLSSILPLLEQTANASIIVRQLSDIQKKIILEDLALIVEENSDNILAENLKDLEQMPDTDSKKDRLVLNKKRITDLAKSIRVVASLPDPSGKILIERTLPNGIHLKKIAVPLGVVGIIYESRPNVTLDVTALCLRSGNAVVLRGGSDAWFTNCYLVQLIHTILIKHNIATSAVALLPTDRQWVKEMLTATRYIDIIIPRGSESLIQFVRQHSLVPTIETGAGVCHTYIESEADLAKARDIVVNAKVSRPAVCNALDTILVDAAVAPDFLPMLLPDFLKHEVEILADMPAFNILKATGYPYLKLAVETDFGQEFLAYRCSIKTVNSLKQALEHIHKYSSRHSEVIVSENTVLCEQFMQEVDAAAVYANVSSRFTDGEAFGLGAEIGISTQKLHARGPFALEKLVTEKWLLTGNGQVR